MKAFVVGLCLLASVSVWASDVPERDVWRANAIDIQGLDRTERKVVERELLFRAGGLVTRAQLEESVQRLRNLGLFRVAEYSVIPVDPSGVNVKVVIDVDERWTILPFFNISFGGDLFSLLAGIYDVNLLGRFLEAGFRYQRLGSTNSYVLWFHDPRFLDKRVFVGGQVWWTNRLRYFFDDQGEATSGYLRERRYLRLVGSKEFSRMFSAGAGISIQEDRFTTELVSDEFAQAQREFGLPDDQIVAAWNLNATLGRINDDSFLRSGTEFAVGTTLSPAFVSSEGYVDVAAQLLSFQRFRWKQNIGLRVGVAATTADHLENQYFLGGLDTVRGFYDSRFRGPAYWYTNLEYRIPSFDYPWFVLQHIAFADAVGVTDRASQFWDADGVSMGIGLRILSPKIYRFGARIDYALPVKGTGTTPLSFGVQQFF